MEKVINSLNLKNNKKNNLNDNQDKLDNDYKDEDNKLIKHLKKYYKTNPSLENSNPLSHSDIIESVDNNFNKITTTNKKKYDFNIFDAKFENKHSFNLSQKVIIPSINHSRKNTIDNKIQKVSLINKKLLLEL